MVLPNENMVLPNYIGRIIYLALKQISVSYLALENLNFLIWHQVKIFFRKWHCRPFSLINLLVDWFDHVSFFSMSDVPLLHTQKTPTPHPSTPPMQPPLPSQLLPSPPLPLSLTLSLSRGGGAVAHMT